MQSQSLRVQHPGPSGALNLPPSGHLLPSLTAGRQSLGVFSANNELIWLHPRAVRARNVSGSPSVSVQHAVVHTC